MKKTILSALFIFVFALAATSVRGEDVVIEKGKKVKINYTLRVNGEIADTSEGREPLEYTQGEGMIIPGLEKELAGLKAGDKKTVTVAPEEAYGPIDPKGIIELPRASLPSDQEPQPGMVLQTQTKEGTPVRGTVVEVKPDVVVLNFNHPLAGQTLVFDIEIVGVE